MKFFKHAGTGPALALVALLAAVPGARAATLEADPVVDRGLPEEKLNNTADALPSNTVQAFGEGFQTGDTFTLEPTGSPSLPSWRIDRLRTWFVAGPPDGGAQISLGSIYTDLSLFLGMRDGSNTISRVAMSKISGNDADAENVTITPVTYEGGLNYQATDGGFLQIWQVDFTDLGKFSAGDYAFSVAGLPDDKPLFNHASDANLGGVPADGADNFYVQFSGSAYDQSLSIDGLRTGSDINVLVYATPVPLPAALPLLLAALGGLGVVAGRRRKAA